MGRIIFYTIFSLLINYCMGNYVSTCKVVGNDNLFSIYKDKKNPKFINNTPNIYFENSNFKIGYCECYTENGNCRIEFDSNNNGTFYKNIIEYEFQKDYYNLIKDNTLFNYKNFNVKTNLKNPTFQDIYNDYVAYSITNNKEELSELINIKANPDKDLIFFSTDYTNGVDDWLNRYGFNSMERLIEDEEKSNNMYYLFYSPNVPVSSLKRLQQYTYPFAGYKIRRALECISDNKEFNGNNTIKNAYSASNYTPLDIDCTWGDPSYELKEDFTSKGFFSTTINFSKGLLLLISLVFILL